MKNPFKDSWSRVVKKDETDSPEIAELTNEQKLFIDINRDFLKSDFARSDAIERKISWLLLTHAAIFALINTIFGTCTGLAQILCVGCFVLYGISFVLSLLALKPVNLYFTPWDRTKDIDNNNDILVKDIEETRKSVNVQCDRFERSRNAFVLATFVFLIFFVSIAINKMEWGENMKIQKKNYAASSAITSTNNITSVTNALKGPAKKPSKPKPNRPATPAVSPVSTKTKDTDKLTKR